MKRTWIVAAAVLFIVSAAYAVTREHGRQVFDWITVGNLTPQPYATISATTDLTRAQWRSASYFPVSTSGGSVDIEVSGTFEASDYGAHKLFMVTVGGTNPLTITADGAGVTTVTSPAACTGANSSCEDVGDYVDCVPIAAQVMVCTFCCAD